MTGGTKGPQHGKGAVLAVGANPRHYDYLQIAVTKLKFSCPATPYTALRRETQSTSLRDGDW